MPAQPSPLMLRSLAALAKAEAQCTRCPLYKHATQVVPGEGPRRGTLMFVGEQPGNEEDLAGKPFVGPAGKIFDRALAEAGIDRKKAFVTNAVKHFKFLPRGKRRLHQRPNTGEIDACRWWLDREFSLVKPVLTVALGATAARGVLAKSVTIKSVRGRIIPTPQGAVLVTIHPSWLLRIREAEARHQEYAQMVHDFRQAAAWAEAPPASAARG